MSMYLLPRFSGHFFIGTLHSAQSQACFTHCNRPLVLESMELDTQQELITLSNNPLHGVTLSFDNTVTSTPYQINATFGAVEALPATQRCWELVDEGERYQSVISLSGQQDRWQLAVDCEGKGTFELDQDTLSIDWQPQGTGPGHYLQTLGLSLYLELKGHLCLHANTLVKEHQAHLFLAPSRTGKSTLTALLTTLGFSLTTDDMAALYQTEADHGYKVYPSWAKVRLWPDSANLLKTQLRDRPLQQKKVHERFAKQEISFAPSSSHTPTPVTAMYYLNRVEETSGTPLTDKVEISKITPSAALIILMQNSMLGDAYRGLGIEKQRITKLAQLLQTVPFYKISYASGLDKLPDIANQIDKFINTQYPKKTA